MPIDQPRLFSLNGRSPGRSRLASSFHLVKESGYWVGQTLFCLAASWMIRATLKPLVSLGAPTRRHCWPNGIRHQLQSRASSVCKARRSHCPITGRLGKGLAGEAAARCATLVAVKWRLGIRGRRSIELTHQFFGHGGFVYKADMGHDRQLDL
jgi:hypothetical protein